MVWGLRGLAGALALKTIWELLDEIMDEAAAESQGDEEEPSADAPCKNSSAGHRQGHTGGFSLSAM